MTSLTDDATRRPDSETLIFLHIPKTAGVSLSRILTSRFLPDEAYHIVPNGPGRSPIFSKAHGRWPEFQALPVDERRRLRLVLGHVSFGVHRLLPGPATYVTVFRDPVERVISHYGQYNRRLQTLQGGSSFTPVSFEDFARERPDMFSNLQTRAWYGEDFDGQPPRVILEQATNHLHRHCSVLGTMERFAEMLALLEMTFGWQRMPYAQENIGTYRPHHSAISPQQRDWIAEHNQLDQALYEFADCWMTERIRALPESDFQTRLAGVQRRRLQYRLFEKPLAGMIRRLASIRKQPRQGARNS